MEFEKTLDERRSVRSFKEEPIPKEEIEDILEKSNMAPSAGNEQAREFVVIEEDNKKKEIAKTCLGQEYVAQAPTIIIVCANQERAREKYGERAEKLYSIVETSLAAQNLMLSAAEKGMGTVYVGAFNEEELKKAINAPEHIRPIGIIPIGYPKEKPDKTPRFNIQKLVHRESF